MHNSGGNTAGAARDDVGRALMATANAVLPKSSDCAATIPLLESCSQLAEARSIAQAANWQGKFAV